MKRTLLFVVSWLFVVGSGGDASAQLTLLGQFNPSNEADLCGVAFDQTDGNVWVYGCSAANVQRYSNAGVFISQVTRPGEAANDVDIEFAPAAFTLNATLVPKGSLLFINGETGPAEVYALDKATGAVNATLNTAFGVSHVVGGAYHPGLSRLFLLQDNVPGSTEENRIGQIDTVTGGLLTSFQTTTNFAVSFGDVEVCRSTGNLLVVSSIEGTMAEYKPAGTFVQEYTLPASVSALSGIGIDDSTGEIWVGSTGGLVSRLGGNVCPAASPAIPALPRVSLVVLALALLGATQLARLRREAPRA